MFQLLFSSLRQKKLARLNNKQEKEHQLCSGLVQAFFPGILVPVTVNCQIFKSLQSISILRSFKRLICLLGYSNTMKYSVYLNMIQYSFIYT
jgi:hypothetical protein